MEDFIYILIGIAWIGFSIYSQQKKLKKKQQEAADRKAGAEPDEESAEYETAEKSLFEKLFEDYNENEPAYKPVEEALKEQSAREAERPKNRFSSVELASSRRELVEANSGLSSEYYKSTKGNKKQQEEREKKAEEYQGDEQDSIEEKSWDFDLRKAVIYSAILERPYD